MNGLTTMLSLKMLWNISLTKIFDSGARRVATRMAESVCFSFIVFLTAFYHGSVEFHTGCFVIPKEACLEFVFDCSVDLLAYDREEAIGVVADDLVNDYRLIPSLNGHGKSSYLGFNKLTDIHIVSVFLSSLVAIYCWLEIAMSGGFCFSKILVERNLRRRALKHRGGSWEVDICRRLYVFNVRLCEALLNEDGLDACRRSSELAVIGTRARF